MLLRLTRGRRSRGAEARDRDPEGLRVGDAEDAGLATCVRAVQEVPADEGIHDSAPDEVHVVRAGGLLVEHEQITQGGIANAYRRGQAAAGQGRAGHWRHPERPALGGQQAEQLLQAGVPLIPVARVAGARGLGLGAEPGIQQDHGLPGCLSKILVSSTASAPWTAAAASLSHTAIMRRYTELWRDNPDTGPGAVSALTTPTASRPAR